VSDISVRVQPGEVLAIVGPIGAGKSSFLRLLNRLEKPTGGAVCSSEPLTSWAPEAGKFVTIGPTKEVLRDR
jgi:putative ABC transport system ATP-binding protein